MTDKHFPPFCGFSFQSCDTVPFDVQELLILAKFNLSIFFLLWPLLSVPYLRNHCPIVMQICLDIFF